MSEPIWIDAELVLAIHDRLLVEHGGGEGVRDEALLESALSRPRNHIAYANADIIELARQYGRYGYRKIAALLLDAGWLVNDKLVERIWRREGLKVQAKQPKRGRLWLNDGS